MQVTFGWARWVVHRYAFFFFFNFGVRLGADLIHTVAKTGGHLGSSLGVVELTLALHYVFNTPEDKIIFDVGHQAYIHKILTGRRSGMPTIRQQGGLSGAILVYTCCVLAHAEPKAQVTMYWACHLHICFLSFVKVQGSPNAVNHHTIPLVLATAPPQFLRRLAWLLGGMSKAGRTT